MPTSRRSILAFAGLSSTGWPLLSAHASKPEQADPTATLAIPKRLTTHLQALFGDTEIPVRNVTLALPALAENGNSVALGVKVANSRSGSLGTSSTNNADVAPHLTQLYLFAEKNPLPDIARFEFPEAGNTHSEDNVADINTRIRLSDSQRIIAIAEYSDGALAAGEASIVVTLAACIDLSE